ncbi:MAG: mercury resistance system transport protein MerF [Rhodothermales bacterium]
MTTDKKTRIMSLKTYTRNKLVVFGGIGVTITALCCFTPLLVWGVAAVGAAALGAYLDFVLLPLLVVFAAMTYAGIRHVRRHGATTADDCCDVSPGGRDT